MRAAVLLFVFIAGSARADAQSITPDKAKPVEPVKAKELTPDKATTPTVYQGKTITPDKATTPAVYQGKSMTPEPARAPTPSPARGADAARGATPPTPVPAMPPNGNPVEPLSVPIQLSMRRPEIQRAMGDQKPGWDRRTLDYGAFRVQVGGLNEEIWHFTIKEPGVTLSSGIGVGSTRADVRAVFGSARPFEVGQYRLSLRYDGDRVREITIDPSGSSFVPLAEAVRPAVPVAPSPANPARNLPAAGGGRAPTPAPTPAPAPAPTPASTPKTAASSILGPWVGHTQALTGGFYTVGTLDLNADGTYLFGNGGKGRFKVDGTAVTFLSGPLTAWDSGRATRTKPDAIEFAWTNKDGSQQWFAFTR